MNESDEPAINMDEPVIAPFKGKEKCVPPVCIMGLSGFCWQALENALQAQEPKKTIGKRNMHFYSLLESSETLACAGPILGAPAAVMVLEDLIALGAKMVIAFGCAGSLQPDLAIGDIIVPLQALSEEGTSQHYIPEVGHCGYSEPIPSAIDCLRSSLLKSQISWREGTIWTTDAPYREMKSKVRQYQARQILAVEMEVSALFTVSRFRQIPLASLLVISDELGTLRWNPGFYNGLFRQSIARVASFLIQIGAKPCIES